MRYNILALLVAITFLFACNKKQNTIKDAKIPETIEKISFANKVLHTYLADTLSCNYLDNDLSWKPFQTLFFEDNAKVLKDYITEKDKNFIKNQLKDYVLTEEEYAYFPDFEVIENNNDSLVLGIRSLDGISLPVFNEEGNTAFIGFSSVRGELAGYGMLIVLQKKNNKWRVVEYIDLWIS